MNDGTYLIEGASVASLEMPAFGPVAGLAPAERNETRENGPLSRPPRVSIIVSNYNYERYLAAAVDSALAQTIPDCEVIVVDDGSTDGSRAVLERYRDDPRVTLIMQENGGQAVAMNIGFAASRGDIVIFLDSDDALKPDAAETVLSRWRPGLSRCQFALEVIDKEHRRLGLHPFSQTMEDGDLNWKLIVGGYFRFIPTSGNAFARAALAPILPMPVEEWRLCADTYLVTMTTAYGEVLNIGEPLGFYRIHEANNWYREVLDPEHLRVIWRQHFQVWRSLTRPHAIAPSTAPDPRTRAQDADLARLHVYRRLLAAYMFEPGIVPARQVREVRREALRALFASSLTLKRKLLYAGLFALVGAKRWQHSAAGKWNAHHWLRPKKFRALIDWLKGDDFYEWMKRRPLPAQLATFPIGDDIHFGRGRRAEAFQWYGWDRSEARSSWTVGREAALIGQLPDDCGDVDVELQLAPFTANWFKEQRVTVSVNGSILIERCLPQQRVLRFPLSRAVAKRGQPLVIGLTCPDCIAPNQIERKRGNYLPLGFAVQRLKFTARKSLSGATAGTYAPLGQTISFSDPAARAYLDAAWHPPSDGVARMAQRRACLRMSILNGSSDPHVLTLKLAGLAHPTLRQCGLRIDAGGQARAVIDATVDREVGILLRPGAVAENGALEVAFVTDNLLAPPDGADIRAAGAGLLSFRVERFAHPVNCQAFTPGFIYNFAAGGKGLPFRTAGWHAPDESGSVSAEVEAKVAGLFFTRSRYVFVTAVVYPAFQAPGDTAQRLTIACCGREVAIYEIVERAEVTAIVPAAWIGTDCKLNLEFRASNLARPVDFGVSDESRPLGVGLALLRVE